MGHLYPSNIDTVFLKRIYAKGSCSLAEALVLCEKKKLKVSCAEGEYEERYMLQMALNSCLAVHYYRGELVPDYRKVKGKKKYINAFKRWQNGESVGDLSVFESLPFHFQFGLRRKYKQLIIEHIES